MGKKNASIAGNEDGTTEEGQVHHLCNRRPIETKIRDRRTVDGSSCCTMTSVPFFRLPCFVNYILNVDLIMAVYQRMIESSIRHCATGLQALDLCDAILY